MALLSRAVSYAQQAAGCSQPVQPVAGVVAAPALATNTNVITLGDTAYFIAGSAATTKKYLWRTDGTPTGTFTVTAALADFTPNYLLTTFQDKILLRASTPATGAELWRSDGTTAGTQLLKELAPGPAGMTYAGWFVFGGRFFFAAYQNDTTQWWVTDVTAAQAFPLATLYPGAAPDNAQVLTQSSTALYLTAHVAENEVELWRFDRRGFRLIKRFTGAVTGIGQALLQRETLYFFASVADGPTGLWRSNGTTVGTTLLWEKPFVAQAEVADDGGVYPYTLLAGGAEQLFFFEADPPLLRLWRLQPSGDVPALVKTIRARSANGVYYDVQYDTALVYNQTLYFTLRWHDPLGNESQIELWQSDGTAGHTYRLTTLPATTRLAFGAPQGLILASPTALVALPWSHPSPTVICTFAAPFLFAPNPVYQQGQLYFTGRSAGTDVDRLWYVDLASVHPTTVFFPVIGR